MAKSKPKKPSKKLAKKATRKLIKKATKKRPAKKATKQRTAKEAVKKPVPIAAAAPNAKNGVTPVQARPAATAALSKEQQPDAGAPKRLAPHFSKVRAHVRESFGKIVMAMMALPRYRNQTVADLQFLLLEPLTRDRVAMAYPRNGGQNNLSDLVGVAIWATVSDEADTHIRSQIKAGIFPVRLKPQDWNSGKIVWLLDVIAADPKSTSLVISNFGKVLKGSKLRMHPMISKLVDAEMLKKMGARMTPSVLPKT